MKKKRKGEHKTWALFRHVPNNRIGRKFLESFKKYKNADSTHYLKGRVPRDGGRYDMGGNCLMSRASEFSIYVKTPKHIEYEDRYWKLRGVMWTKGGVIKELEAEVKELTKARLDWRHSFYELHEMNIFQFAWYKFKEWRR
tara:strand:- start:8 stop:430 length:423 start_codon:yes stop_codon:yes gene_type:complete